MGIRNLDGYFVKSMRGKSLAKFEGAAYQTAEQQQTMTHQAVTRCHFCVKSLCQNCFHECEQCRHAYCTFCLTSDYAHGLEHVCLDCARDVNDGMQMQIDGQWELHAKKSSKNVKSKKATTTTASRGGGFGLLNRKSAAAPLMDDDYSVFPALEPNVMRTLVPAVQPEQAGELPNDVYQRLKQIYGFGNFNYPSSAADETATVADALSIVDGASSSAINPLDINGVDTNDVLKSVLASDKGPASLFGAPSSSVGIKDLSLSLNLLPAFQNLSVLHTDPLVIRIHDFFTHEECDRYVTMVQTKNVLESRSPTVGKDRYSKSQRTSTTWYNEYENVPELMAKACRLLGLSNIHHWEEPQTVRYQSTQKFTWHLDALGPAENQAALGGQRTATLLVYLSELQENEGGATVFRDLGKDGSILKVRPVKGSALLFFPAAGGIPDTPYDIRTLHAGEAVVDTAVNDKWISQLWLRNGVYKPSLGNHASAAESIADYCSSVNNNA
ncbi:hypothetical protein MPSEU_000887800 [Mayamaea pseudoterrestris]|nr:hypothetical protein MPSEU_000887800 [Mayamaea pseudoterrestris]